MFISVLLPEPDAPTRTSALKNKIGKRACFCP
jgi:hypothetical protein